MKTWSGPGCWIQREEAPVVRGALVGTDRITFDVTKEGDPYTVELHAGPSGWRGTWRCDVDNSSGAVEARLYRSEASVALVGKWIEDGEQFWCVELR